MSGSFLATDWELVWTLSQTAAPMNELDTGYEPYGDLICPILLDSDLIAVRVTNPQGKASWQSAGYVFQKLRSGLSTGGANDSLTAKIWCRLNTVNLIRLPWKISGWELSFRPNYWHQEINLDAWEYTGNLPTINQEILNVVTNIQSYQQGGTP